MRLWSCLLFLLSVVSANVEKTVFLGPPATTVPNKHPNLDDLCLIPLSPLHLTARTRLNASFPTTDAPKGTETWILLDHLTPGARYEVRICWLATVRSIVLLCHSPADIYKQPTTFDIYTHILEETFERPELITSLSTYAYTRQAELNEFQVQQLAARRMYDQTYSTAPQKSILFLQIFAAADYFSLNKTLMSDVPPVLVDIILDPYLLNVFPKSLIPTAAYLIVLAVGGWFLSGLIWRQLIQIADASPPEGASASDAVKKKMT